MRLSRRDAIADLDTLIRVDEDVHPDLYHAVGRDSVRRLRADFIARLPDSVSRVELWRQLATFTAIFADGHTGIAIPADELRRGGARTAALLPATFEIDQDDRLMVRTAGEPSLQSGDRVLSINGLAIESLLQRLKSRVSGEREVWRQHLVVRDFAARLWYDDIRAPYTVLLSRPGTAGTQTI